MGKIKEGLGTLIGNAGEYYVMAELLKRGIIAALAPRNAPAFDILATNTKKTVSIRVKTKSEQYDAWQWVIKKDGDIFNYLQDEDDFSILVNLTEKTENMNYFIIPTKILNDWLIQDYEEWIRTPGRGGRPHSPDNKKRNLERNKYDVKLKDYENNWNILWV